MKFFEELDLLYMSKQTILGIENWKKILSADSPADLISACRSVMQTLEWQNLYKTGDDFVFLLMRELKIKPEEAFTRFKEVLRTYEHQRN